MLGTLVQETANNPGTGTTVALLGASVGRVPFLALGSGNTVYYFLDDGSQSEWGFGVYTSGAPDTLTRATVIGNTAGTTARLNFSGSVRVYSMLPADRWVYRDQLGRVGIGTSAPTGNMHIRDAGQFVTVLLTPFNDATKTHRVLAANETLILDANGAAPVLQFTRSNSTVENGRFTQNGEFLVGPNGNFTGNAVRVDAAGRVSTRRDTTSAAAHLDFNTPNGVVGSITTNANATAYNTSSDARLKDVVGAVDDAGAAIDALAPVQYRWKSQPGGPVLVGFLAQEAAEVVPQSVTPGSGEPGNDDFVPHGMDMSTLVPLLWAEVRALRARVAALETEAP